jgi:GT2 family glycosyltransferase
VLDLTISIVSWNIKDLLEKCLKSVFEHTKGISYEVFVSDNGSTDGTIEMVKKDFPQVKLIENGANIGFTKANNKVIREAKGRYVILLNSDTIITPRSMEALVKFMDEHPEAGAVGPKLEYPDGSPQPSCRSFPTIETELYKALFLDQLFPKSERFGKHMMSFWDHNDEREVDQLMGAAMFVRREVIDQIGLLDENIIFWFDEVDWCRRIKDKGWKIYFTPASKIYHYKNKGFAQWKGFRKSFNAMKIWRKSRNYYYRKHHGIPSMLLVNLLDAAQLAIIAFVLFLIIRGVSQLI